MSMYGIRDPDWEGAPEPAEVTGDIVGLVRSKDHGATWTDFSLVSGKSQNETTFLPLDDRRILAASRTGAGSVTLFESLDGGYMWQGPLPLTQGSQHPADLVRLQSGRILLVHGNRRAPIGVCSMVSEDEGKTWRYDDRVMLAWDSNNGDCGYPSLVQLDDGTIVMLYYSVGTAQFGGDELCVCVRFTEQQWLDAMGR
ncbi:MAG: exo-alpha-sialidase [Armatimonadetes bacterium]|nr:exo-alpha-sialidase [Armatimonadota bacterium]